MTRETPNSTWLPARSWSRCFPDLQQCRAIHVGAPFLLAQIGPADIGVGRLIVVRRTRRDDPAIDQPR